VKRKYRIPNKIYFQGELMTCANCGWTYRWDFAISDGDWFARRADEGNYVLGSGWTANCVTADGTAKRCVIQYNFPTPDVEIESFDTEFFYQDGDAGGSIRKLTMREFSANDGGGSTLATSTSGVPPAEGEDTGSLVSTQTPHSMELNCWSSGGDCTGNVIYRAASISGIGTRPTSLTGGDFV